MNKIFKIILEKGKENFFIESIVCLLFYIIQKYNFRNIFYVNNIDAKNC